MKKIEKIIVSFMVVNIFIQTGGLATIHASELVSKSLDNNSSEVVTSTDSKLYAPVHPTSQEVEEAASTDLVVFNDSNFEKAVAKKIGVPVGEVTVGDMRSLTALNVPMKSITDITGIEYATNLKTFNGSINEIRDISPLAGLTMLTDLDLSSNNIVNIKSLSELTNLIKLNLSSNEIIDIKSLTNLTNLKQLNLHNNNIFNISSLSGLVNLEEVDLGSNNISDISSLATLVNLTDLDASGNNVSDISVLSKLTKLKYLTLSRNKISDVTPLSKLTNLNFLILGENNIEHIEPLANLKNLYMLDLSHNKISDMSIVGDFEYLVEKTLAHQWITAPDITVYDDSEVFYEVIDEDGKVIPVSLGVPKEGSLGYQGKWANDADFIYSGTVTQRVNYIVESSLTGNNTAATNEEVELTDSQLISLFNVTSADGQTITVDQSAVDYSVPGDYQLIFSDESGNQLIATLTVTDILPTIEVTSEQVTITIGTTVTDYIATYGATATEITAGDLTSSITVDESNVDYSAAGTYQVILMVADQEANQVTKTVSLVIEEEPSVVDPITGNNSAATNEEVELTDSQLISLFNVTSADGQTITVDQSAVDYSVPGDYQLIFSDESGNQLIATLTVTDILPTIEVTSEQVTITIGSTVTDYIATYGATATEITAGDLTSSITVDESNVDYSAAGTYQVILMVADQEANQVTKTVSLVIEDEPTVVDPITGNNTAATNEEVELTDSQLISLFEVVSADGQTITVDQSAVDYSVPGDYQLIFSDESGNQLIATLTVTDILPTIEVTSEQVTITIGSTVTDYIATYGATATEITAGDLTSSITVDESNVDYSAAGTYQVILMVADQEANQVTKTVSLVIEDEPTVVDPITGNNTAATNEEVELTDSQLISLFEVVSADDQTITVDQSAVDYSVPGDYQLIFSDESGNQLIATLTVTDILPTIEVTSEQVTITIGSTVTDYIATYGATATEITAGDLTSSITVDESNVDYSAAGTYQVILMVADQEANQVTKTVSLVIEDEPTVVDPITGNNTAATNEEVELTDSQLISLFNVTSADGQTITVDQSAVDYSVPGDYQLIFSDESGNQLIATLTVTDILPTIEVTSEQVTIVIGSTIDYITAYGATATEITAGDLTSSITVDESNVDYSAAGTYQVILMVADQEANQVTKTVSLVIEDQAKVSEPISGNSQASIFAQGRLSDSQLISLFNVTSVDGQTITVDQSAVDYSTTGSYQVIFTDESGNQFVGILVINSEDSVNSVVSDKDKVDSVDNLNLEDELDVKGLASTGSNQISYLIILIIAIIAMLSFKNYLKRTDI